MEYIADSPLLAHNPKFDIMARARRFERRRLRASRALPGSRARNARVTRSLACCFESLILTERSSCFNVCAPQFFHEQFSVPLIWLVALLTSTPKKLKKNSKKSHFFTQKDHPAPQKLKFCMKKIVFFYSKRPPSLAKN